MSFDEDFKKLIEGIEKDNNRRLETQKKDLLEFYKSNTYGDFKMKMMLERVFSDIYYLQRSTLDYNKYFILIAQKITELEDSLNRNISSIIELSKRVKETESLQE